jgi:hypothetical protein
VADFTLGFTLAARRGGLNKKHKTCVETKRLNAEG